MYVVNTTGYDYDVKYYFPMSNKLVCKYFMKLTLQNSPYSLLQKLVVHGVWLILCTNIVLEII